MSGDSGVTGSNNMNFEVHDNKAFANSQSPSATAEDQDKVNQAAGNAGGEISYNTISNDKETSETTEGFEHYMDKFKEMTELASSRNLEMMIAQTDYGTMLSAAKMRVNPV